ncbi:hypothetical protein P4O66_013181 [Electrophorus voltai]|uniref:C3H1-type domain-containing protein n=1 Tax=Electrophorus voltai TaxID=2609070 RepID=A0AAD9DSL9_9TELE|nr:hypothetical protein P4O66_013181 [Electrophorus voltai]
MDALVGYGVSSDSEAEGDGVGPAGPAEKDVNDEDEGKLRNFLLESGSASCEASSESEREEEQDDAPDPCCMANMHSSPTSLLHPPLQAVSPKLPPPPLEALGPGGLPAGSSVFANPFKQKAEERLNVLCKHVPLTLQARPIQIGGKRMCMAYRKDGRCRFGSRCKFAHDSDLQSTTGLTDEPAVPEDHTDSGVAVSEGDREEEENHRRKKQRVGLSDSLVPPKRALRQYTMQRDRTLHS